MGFLFNSSTILIVCSVFGFSPVLSQDLKERDAFCNSEGCFVIYFERKIFLDSWRSCKKYGGNLATVKRKEEASAIATLFSTLDVRGSRTEVSVWIGLQRQPRQCSSHPLRGFSWTTGDQDTEYTNWQREDSPSMCLVPRCVAMGYSTQEHSDNFMWIDGSCSVPVDGYLCHFAYKGMCLALRNEGSANILYATPFNLLSTILTHVPVGSIANIPCHSNIDENKPVLCILRKNGSVAWSHEPPFCSIPSISHHLCEQDHGGCEHFCRQAGGKIFCDCAEGFHLRYDGQTCEPDVCQGDPCEFECLPLSDGYRCACPDGYMLAPDKHICLDVDECIQGNCQHLCENLPGTFKCQCREGYFLNDKGVCEDIDECVNNSCDHSCENIPGSYTCHCHLDFSVDSEEPRRCQDSDECQIVGICEQMCVNYLGGFECICKEGYELSSDHSTCQKIEDQTRSVTPPLLHSPQPEPGRDPVMYPWNPEPSTDHWPVNLDQHLDWLANPSTVSNPDVIWLTTALQDKPSHNSVTQGSEEDKEKVDVLEQEERSQFEVNVLSTQTILFPTSILSTMSDWYVDEEEATTTITFHSTSTISEGAWNWSPGFSTSTHSLENPIVPDTDSAIIKEIEQEQYSPRDYSQFPGQESGKEENNYVDITHSQGAAVPTEFSTPKPLPPFLDEDGGSGDNMDSVQEDRELKQSNIGLLVGLSVFICFFIFMMVALGIFYCTHCGVKPRNKNATECYHWISCAHDKQGAPSPSTGDKTAV
ncbi:CD248 molecule, endosialin a [Girardinichthys multiradiatus]|uniref:CD248 molecule, endosialin a n=1 Tax=Girardinichthys multiradiatus TaxID=208333 RepID=UPI001FAD472C|nr:CD248 molecule, endosialin a [Girardinichthys multiradiatus]